MVRQFPRRSLDIWKNHRPFNNGHNQPPQTRTQSLPGPGLTFSVLLKTSENIPHTVAVHITQPETLKRCAVLVVNLCDVLSDSRSCSFLRLLMGNRRHYEQLYVFRLAGISYNRTATRLRPFQIPPGLQPRVNGDQVLNKNIILSVRRSDITVDV